MMRDNGALELHIRVDGQNLSTIPEKCNTGTLRPPSDPSWPKIPLRRLTGNTDGIIKPPCVVTVTGTPRRNCSNTLKTIACQYPTSRISEKYQTFAHMPERLPGCVDPRFKRQVLRQQAEKPDEFCNANRTREDTSHECQSDGAEREQVASNIRTISVSTSSKTPKESGNGKVIQQHTRNISEIIPHCDDGCVLNWARDKENINLNIPKISLGRVHPGNLNARGNDASCENSTNITGKLGNAQGRIGDSRSNHTLQRPSHSALFTLEQKSSEKTGTTELAESCLRCSCAKVSSDKMLRKGAQLTNEEHQRNAVNWAKLQRGEVCCNSRRKTASPITLSRKAKSFLRRRSRLATTDSDCTLMLPGPRRLEGKQYERTCDRLKMSQLSRRRNWMNGMNSIRVKSSDASKRRRMNRSRLLANLRTNDPSGQPSPIPLKTQELLNKSYWEYYRDLRRKIVSGTARKENKRSGERRSRANLPASKTLRQCSVLSCVINNTLDASEKALRDPAVVADRSNTIANGSGENVREALGSSSIHAKRNKRKKMNHVNKRLFGLKAIPFLVILVYGAIIFLPMMYDYLMFDEEQDDYEDANYVAFTLEYIASSFEEAFDEIVDVLSIVFPHLVSFNREL